MKGTFWAVVDAVAHVLYCPAMWGRRCARYRRTHDVHLIPGRWLAWVCARRDHH
ncbi:hypothetical protein ACFFMN_23675 [Planobispora siamensis]|uniref:hypothetical protein n=1 Tax=Planobispora siamensis TaxID=936338 RepID=UPI00194E6F45|nr:hypothetical protein [Planobispora siamensis]